MTELYIDGQKVLLNDDFMIDFYRYNPFFSKKGDYTYDIDINLNVPENARIYKHIQRPNRMDIWLNALQFLFLTRGQLKVQK